MFFIKSKHIKLHLFMSRGVLGEGRWISIVFKPQRLLKPPPPLKKKKFLSLPLHVLFFMVNPAKKNCVSCG